MYPSKITAIERNRRNVNGGHLPYFCTLHFGGVPYLTERSPVCDFDRTVNFLSNDSQIIGTYTEVLKYNVKFNMPERNILKVITPNFFVQCICFRSNLLYDMNYVYFVNLLNKICLNQMMMIPFGPMLINILWTIIWKIQICKDGQLKQVYMLNFLPSA